MLNEAYCIIWNNRQEGAEIEEDNGNNEDIPDPLLGEGEEKTEQEPVERPRKTSKYMTKYERARILGTRALQIRSICFFPALHYSQVRILEFENL